MKKVMLLGLMLCLCFCIVGCGQSRESSTSKQNADLKIVKEGASLTDEQSGNIIKILSDCEIKDVQEFKHEPALDNVLGEGVKGYRVKTSNIEKSTVYLKDGNAFYIGSSLGGEVRELYSKNQIQAKISDYTITSEEFSELKIRCQRGVESILKSPKTAEFAGISEWKMGKDKEKIVVQAYVDSQNSFGALLRSDFWITFTPDKEKVTSVIINGKEYMK